MWQYTYSKRIYLNDRLAIFYNFKQKRNRESSIYVCKVCNFAISFTRDKYMKSRIFLFLFLLSLLFEEVCLTRTNESTVFSMNWAEQPSEHEWYRPNSSHGDSCWWFRAELLINRLCIRWRKKAAINWARVKRYFYLSLSLFILFSFSLPSFPLSLSFTRRTSA